MPTTVRQEATSHQLLTLTVDQYHRMLETGILTEGEPIELLDGLLVVKDRGGGMTLSPIHALAPLCRVPYPPDLDVRLRWSTARYVFMPRRRDECHGKTRSHP